MFRYIFYTLVNHSFLCGFQSILSLELKKQKHFLSLTQTNLKNYLTIKYKMY